MMKRLAVAFIVATVWMPEAWSYVELNGFYTNGGLTTDASETSSNMFFEGSIGFAIDRKSKYLVGWNYSMHSTSDTATATKTYSSTQMGPRFVLMLNKHKTWSFGLGYYLVTTGTFSDGTGASETWKGTALKADFGYNFAVSEKLFVGARLNYSSASYAEKIVGSADYSTVSYTRTIMYPSLYTIWLF